MLGKIKVLLPALLLVILAGCSSSRQSGQPSLPPQTRETASLIDLLNARAGSWQQMKVPVSLQLRQPMNLKLSGTMSMVRGEEIRLSLRFLGFEVAAAQITGDSIRAYAKQPSKLYVAESVRDLLGGFPASVDNLQSLMLAQIFQLGSAGIDLSRCTVDMTDNSYTITPPSSLKGYNYTFTASTASNTLSTLTVGTSGSVTYTYPRGAIDRGLPSDIAVQGSMKGKSVAINLSPTPSKADWTHADCDKPFVIPSGCQRVTAAQLLKLLNN